MSLTEALRTGAPDAFAVLYDEYAGPLYAYCHVMVGDEAADAVRDTFIAVARHPGEAPSDDGALPVWLHALARSECVRRGALVRRPVSTSPADPVRRALTLLRPEHREALALSTVLEPEEIARVIGVARDTAEMLVRVSQRRLEQAAASVGGREAHDAAMLASLSGDALHRVVTRGYEPPPRQRERVLSSCAAAERAADGALLFDADGMPIPLDGLFRDAEEPTRPFTRISPEEPVREVQEATASAEPASRAAHVSHARPKNRSRKQPFLRRRHDNLVEVAGLAACVAAATGVLALWPSPHTSGTSNVDGTSLLVHRGQTASRSAQPSVPVRPGPPDAATSKPGTSASPKPTTSSSGAPATTTPPGTTAPAGPSQPGTPGTPPKSGGSGPTHPTHPTPPTSPPGSPTHTPTPDPTPTTPSDSPTDHGSDSPSPDPSGS
ncbi:sigma-70 family RNA polymerase sigma factor [Actinoallomurus sp. NBC_01490]|uniref:RNA polymerase sigma factor n=1 Tax=Actinoallomurus sp. NBC_01490 TaxID=2903557 RepID=UPI002E366F88|nr:sigma-70 family RNA polymerase sigma factor [Actinoallomurus sp. NBC_01490]